MSSESDATPTEGREEARERVREMQRRSLLDAMAHVLVEKGWRGTTVAAVAARADISPSRFRELFKDLDDCFLALAEQVTSHSTALMIDAFEQEVSWQDGVLAGLEALLVFMDSEPMLARVCVVETLAGPPTVLVLRARSLESLKPFVDGGRERLSVDEQPSPVTATATIAAVVGILQERFLASERPLFVELLGELAGLVVAPYLGISAAGEQIERGNARAGVLAREMGTRSEEAPVSIPREVRHAGAHRLRLCLLYVSENPGVSNQDIAKGIDLRHHGQTSKVLDRLRCLDLLVKQPGGAGRPNVWQLTPNGERVLRALGLR